MEQLLRLIKNCRECEQYLPLGVNPVMAAGKESRIIVIGQAPGRIVHKTNIPWNDKSGDNLRRWMGIGKEVFYNTKLVTLMPMGFCYPGSGRSGDLPPRSECAPLWHPKLIAEMPYTQLILLVGMYSQKYYLKDKLKMTLTETVRHYNEFLPAYFPLPHPSPRNNIWQTRNRWFNEDVVPALQNLVSEILRAR